MAKKKGKGKKRGKGKAKLAAPAMLGTFAGGVFGKVVEKLLADSIRDFVLPERHHHKKHDDQRDRDHDVAARLLAALADNGPKPIARLLADTNLALSPMLHALQTLREFRLINFVGGDGVDCETVEVTRAGAETATVIRSNHIRAEAAKMLER